MNLSLVQVPISILSVKHLSLQKFGNLSLATSQFRKIGDFNKSSLTVLVIAVLLQAFNLNFVLEFQICI